MLSLSLVQILLERTAESSVSSSQNFKGCLAIKGYLAKEQAEQPWATKPWGKGLYLESGCQHSEDPINTLGFRVRARDLGSDLTNICDKSHFPYAFVSLPGTLSRYCHSD